MADGHTGVVKSHATRIGSKEGPLCWCWHYCHQLFSRNMDDEIFHEPTVTALDSTRNK